MTRRLPAVLAAGALVVAAAPALAAPSTEPVDVTSDGTAVPGEVGRPVISGDGRWVVFSSEARLTPDDSSDAVDVYARDLVEDETLLVTPAPDDRYRLNYDPAISDDGRFVAFTSQGPGLLPADANAEEDVYLKDLRTGALTIVTARGGRARGGRFAAVSGNGRWVAFVGNGLVRGDRNGDRDVYVRNVATGRAELVSRLDDGRQTRISLDDVDISDDGSRVAYVGGGALYVFDRATDRRVRADVNGRGDPAAHPFLFGNLSLSGDGRRVILATQQRGGGPTHDF
jgi:Tol biopolymer transport system component